MCKLSLESRAPIRNVALPRVSFTAIGYSKRAVENTPSLDFLKDLVSSIPDPSGADEEYESSEKVPKKRAARGKAGANGGSTSGLGETGSASPVPASASAHASASTSTSASGLKKIKISHSASAAKAESTEDATPSTSASTFSLPPMPIPQDSRPNVAIPISSLLSDTVTDYGPEDGQGQFNSAPKEEEIGHWNTVQTTTSKAAEDDDYDNEESKGSASMQLDQTTAVPAEQAQASAAPEAATYKREEDEDYDAE